MIPKLARTEEKEAREPLALPRLSRFPLSIFEGIEELFNDRLFAPWWGLRGEEMLRTPPVDVYEEGEAVVVKAELPGLKKEEIEVSMTGDLLTIAGKKAKEEKVEKKNYYRYERAEGEFTRTVRLPVEVVAEKLAATLKDGVLEVRAPKAETKEKVKVAVA